MKKIIALIFITFLIGCDDIPDGIVNSSSSDYNIKKIIAPEKVSYSSTDSVFTTSVEAVNPEMIKTIRLSVLSEDGLKLVVDKKELLDNGNSANGDETSGDDIFSASVQMSSNNPIGRYQIEYYVTDNRNNTKLVGFHYFDFESSANAAPFISELQFADTLGTGDKNPFLIELKVSDANGYNDIKFVLFNLYDENNQLMSENIKMYDDGNTEQNGDKLKNDGIFTFKNYFTESAKGKKRKFEFWAVDFSNEISNVLIKEVYIK